MSGFYLLSDLISYMCILNFDRDNFYILFIKKKSYFSQGIVTFTSFFLRDHPLKFGIKYVIKLQPEQFMQVWTYISMY